MSSIHILFPLLSFPLSTPFMLHPSQIHDHFSFNYYVYTYMHMYVYIHIYVYIFH